VLGKLFFEKIFIFFAGDFLREERDQHDPTDPPNQTDATGQ
jgi:hypothetical protein